MLSAAALLAVALLGGTVLPTAVRGGVTCPPDSPVCVVVVDTPGQPGSTGNPAQPVDNQRHCYIAGTGEEVACFDPGWGWFNDADSCYWKLVDPQPGDGAWWEGHYPDGAIYMTTCMELRPGVGGGWAWRATPPPGYGAGLPTPQQLAQRAIDQMTLSGPQIHTPLDGDRSGVVGVPVWLWTDVGATTWGPTSATAAVPGLSVTATATANQIVWDMGDGRSETCRNPGTPYYAGGVTSPTCQHIYEQPSTGQPNDAYPVTATTTWDVTWTGGGVSGSLTVTRQSTAGVRIGEVQVLVTQE